MGLGLAAAQVRLAAAGVPLCHAVHLPPLQVQPLLGLLAAAFSKHEEAGG